jgi:uncharacterized protein YjbI with pentapeptide repeats
MPCQFQSSQKAGGPPHGCQFSFGDDEILRVNDEQWCPLHLPAALHSAFPASIEHDPLIHGRLRRFSTKGGKLANFRQCIFHLSVVLGDVPQGFQIDAWDLAGSTFLFDALFKGNLPNLTLSSCHFHANTNIECMIAKDLDLEGSIFDGRTYIGGQIDGQLSLSSAAHKTIVRGEFIAGGNPWAGPVTLSSAEFDGPFSWKNKGVVGAVRANACVFNKRADFSGAKFGEADFRKAHFKNVVTFEKAKFDGWTTFAGARFEMAPRFHDATLYPETTFVGARYDQADNAATAAAYRTLKNKMEGLRNRTQEGIFYALEQRSELKSGAGSWDKRFLSWCYDVLSDYGNSVLRPIVALFVLCTLFGLSYFGLALETDRPAVVSQLASNWQQVTEALTIFTLQQVVRPFAVWAITPIDLTSPLIALLFQKYGLLVRLVATMQSLLSLVTIALALFAVRRRFKME